VNRIIPFLTPEVDFVKTNFELIILALVLASVFFLGYWITAYSLKKLKPDFFSYYPFDKFFPKSGSWSIIYFIITIILLTLLVFVIAKGGFYLAPA
jgi:hypothetical protein